MDELDSAIITRLQADARQTNRELARSLGIAPSTCLERVRLLRKRGVILGYTAQVSLPALNRHVQALIAVQVRPLNREVVDGVRRTLRALPEVLAVFVLAGGDDFVVHVAVQDVGQLHSFLIDRLSGRREIIGFRTSVIYQHDETAVVTPLPPGVSPG
ncbi:Lrp/AsnC family transcriptional regulator [Streptomyces sp. TRM 70351]|uniref:Lrp/AsnC family transcriptional regulator n=1 Tax=Streptomyces sp. TRM 70351 TaxID=3116552 RepID=UPI002E7AE945|nr:Lrp/AsnC family transcriptional regulator [Streptomyces sp. TRM 70351]MEE1930138.1 Lrp/AsnC family transcriptional regulator [Streptomyces sp. TRM 70351]